MVENIVVMDSPYTIRELGLVFGDNNDCINEDILFVEDKDLSNLMVDLGLYASTSKARQAGRVGDIPTGYTEFKASKKVTLYIWNPTE